MLRRWRPVGCHPVHWLLCLSVIDRRANVMSDEVVRSLVTGVLGPAEACRVLGDPA